MLNNMSYHREEKKVVTMRLSKEDDNLIKELARQDNLTKSAWIRRCLFKKSIPLCTFSYK